VPGLAKYLKSQAIRSARLLKTWHPRLPSAEYGFQALDQAGQATPGKVVPKRREPEPLALRGGEPRGAWQRLPTLPHGANGAGRGCPLPGFHALWCDAARCLPPAVRWCVSGSVPLPPRAVSALSRRPCRSRFIGGERFNPHSGPRLPLPVSNERPSRETESPDPPPLRAKVPLRQPGSRSYHSSSVSM